MELCWLTTTRCNQNCEYCDRFLDYTDLNSNQYSFILDKLISYGVNRLTFGGGESLLVDAFSDIVKKAAANGMHLKLVTNGILLQNKLELIPYFDEITFSIDSADTNTNIILGRGANHYHNVNSAIDRIKNSSPNTRINVNSVVTKINYSQTIELAQHIKQWNVQQWRIFRFCPLRGAAVRNRDMFEISSFLFRDVCKCIDKLGLSCSVQFRDYEDMENGYLLISPSGKLCVSRDLKDVVVGDMLLDDLTQWFI